MSLIHFRKCKWLDITKIEDPLRFRISKNTPSKFAETLKIPNLFEKAHFETFKTNILSIND